MSNSKTILKYIIILVVITAFTACAPTKKNPYYEKRKKASRVNMSQLGKNRYYFSPEYQKKLNKMYKRK